MSCKGRGCVFGCSVGKRSGLCQVGYGVDDSFYNGKVRRGCLGPRARIDQLEVYGDSCSCHGCRSNNSLNVFDQYNLDFDQLFVGWSRNCPCRCGNYKGNYRGNYRYRI